MANLDKKVGAAVSRWKPRGRKKRITSQERLDKIIRFRVEMKMEKDCYLFLTEWEMADWLCDFHRSICLRGGVTIDLRDGVKLPVRAHIRYSGFEFYFICLDEVQ